MPHHRVFSDPASGMALQEVWQTASDCDRKRDRRSSEPLREGRKVSAWADAAVDS